MTSICGMDEVPVLILWRVFCRSDMVSVYVFVLLEDICGRVRFGGRGYYDGIRGRFITVRGVASSVLMTNKGICGL